MSASKTILVIGTYDTKDEELAYVANRIRAQGGGVLSMDVSVLGDPSKPCDISKPVSYTHLTLPTKRIV